MVGQQGFAGSGVADITGFAGVPKGSFYQYFESKQAYAVELLDDYWATIEASHAKVLSDEDIPHSTGSPGISGPSGKITNSRSLRSGA